MAPRMALAAVLWILAKRVAKPTAPVPLFPGTRLFVAETVDDSV
jgi:hypothetical protein